MLAKWRLWERNFIGGYCKYICWVSLSIKYWVHKNVTMNIEHPANTYQRIIVASFWEYCLKHVVRKTSAILNLIIYTIDICFVQNRLLNNSYLKCYVHRCCLCLQSSGQNMNIQIYTHYFNFRTLSTCITSVYQD